MSNPGFIDGLVATATPVAPRRMGVEFAALIGIVALQLVGMAYFYSVEAFWYAFGNDPARFVLKIVLFGLAGAGLGFLAIRSMSPGRPGTDRLAQLLVLGLGTAGIVGFDWSVGADLGATIHPQYGWRCVFSVMSLSLPATLVLSLFMARGAPTRPGMTAFLVGLSGGAMGAFVYALQCPFVGVFYLALWYVGGVVLTGLVAGLILPRLHRW